MGKLIVKKKKNIYINNRKAICLIDHYALYYIHNN